MILSHTRRRAPRRGKVVALVAFSLIGLLGVVAISFEGGGIVSERRHAQAVADAAALAAAADLYTFYWTNNGADPSGTASTSALQVASDNGYTNDGTHSKVTVNIPPKSGPYTNKPGYAEVLVEYYLSRSFSSIFSTAAVTVKARAVAIGSPVAADVGILVLDPTGRASFNAQGGGVTTVNGTPIIVNSTNDAAAVAGGGGSVTADKFVIAGNYSTSGNGSFTGPMFTGKPGMPDPLADLPVPDPNSMTVQQNNKLQFTSGTQNLQPGVYRGGINVSGTGSLSLAPGIYYMDRGGFSFSGQGSLNGSGVMIYTNPGNGNSDAISVTGQGSMVLSGPTSGTYKGLTFWQRRDATVTGNVAGTGGQTSITGTFYFPGALLKISGNGGVSNIGSQYISNDLSLGGTGDINISWHPETVAQKRSLFLVE